MTAPLMEVDLGGYIVEEHIIACIKYASSITDVDFDYLLAKASQESSFSVNASADSSSAVGIYQFTSDTWLSQVKRFGTKYGYKEYADAIEYRRGRYRVKSEELLDEILSLRSDPKLSAILAAEYARSNQAYLEGMLKRDIGPSELYIAHFLGPFGAYRLISADKSAVASHLFKEAAEANPGIFFDAEKTPNTVAEVRKILEDMFVREVKRFTNIPPEVFASLPKVLPLNSEPVNTMSAPLDPTEASDAKPAGDAIDLDQYYSISDYGTSWRRQTHQYAQNLGGGYNMDTGYRACQEGDACPTRYSVRYNSK